MFFTVCTPYFTYSTIFINNLLNRDEGSNESALSSSETEDIQSKSLSLLDDLDGAYVNLLQMGF